MVDMQNESSLPDGFGAFRRFSDWALPTQSQRRQKHFSDSTLEDVTALHSFGHEKTASGKTRIEDALTYLDQFPLDQMPEDAKYLLWILLSIAEITSSVEAWNEVNPTFIGDYQRFAPLPETEVQ